MIVVRLWIVCNMMLGFSGDPGIGKYTFGSSLVSCTLDPRTFHMPSKTLRRQATTVSYSSVQYIARSKFIWLVTSSKTERACTNRYARLLDCVRFGSVRVNILLLSLFWILWQNYVRLLRWPWYRKVYIRFIGSQLLTLC